MQLGTNPNHVSEHPSISTPLENFEIPRASLASTQSLRFEYPLPVRNEIVPELVFRSLHPITRECRTDILLANGKIQLFYRPMRETHVSDDREGLVLFAIDLSRDKQVLQIDVNTAAGTPEASYEFSCGGKILGGKAFGDIERGLIDRYLDISSLPGSISHPPDGLLELINRFFE